MPNQSSHDRVRRSPSKRASPGSCSRRNAVTLVEVVVALVLLATLVAGMVVAYSAHHRQALVAVRRNHAIQAADQLLDKWYSGSQENVPRNSFGAVAPDSPMAWRTQVVHQNLIETLPVEVVRLQVYANSSFETPLAQVDVLLPVSSTSIDVGG